MSSTDKDAKIYSARNPLRATVLTRDSTPKMHTIWVRLNAVVFFSFSVLLVLALLTAFSTYGAYDPAGSGVPVVHELKFREITSLRSNGGVDKSHLTFDLKVDLEPAFHWNAKQIFCMVVAEYEGNHPSNLKEDTAIPRNGTYPINQVVLWDRIVEAKEGGRGVAAVNWRTGIQSIDEFLESMGVPEGGGGGTKGSYGNAKGFFGGAQAFEIPEIPVAMGIGAHGAVLVEGASSDREKEKRKKRRKKRKTTEKVSETHHSDQPFLIDLVEQKNTYPLQDRRNELRGADVKLKFYWDMMPFTALMFMTETEKRGGADVITMPKAYF